MQDKQYIIEIRYNNDFTYQIVDWIIKSLHDSNIIVATLANRKTLSNLFRQLLPNSKCHKTSTTIANISMHNKFITVQIC